jgi:hypothetical protein
VVAIEIIVQLGVTLLLIICLRRLATQPQGPDPHDALAKH